MNDERCQACRIIAPLRFGICDDCRRIMQEDLEAQDLIEMGIKAARNLRELFGEERRPA